MPALKRYRDAMLLASLITLSASAAAQTATVPLSAADWEGTDSVRAELYGRRAAGGGRRAAL